MMITKPEPIVDCQLEALRHLRDKGIACPNHVYNKFGKEYSQERIMDSE